jgi:hypothetical protein
LRGTLTAGRRRHLPTRRAADLAPPRRVRCDLQQLTFSQRRSNATAAPLPGFVELPECLACVLQASGSGELFLANQAILVHLLHLGDDSLTVNGANILAFQAGIDWDVTRVKGGTAGCSPVDCSTSICAEPGLGRAHLRR